MSSFYVFVFLFCIGCFSFFLSYRRAVFFSSSLERRTLLSRPIYHGWWAFLVVFFPAFILLIVWNFIFDACLSLFIELHSVNLFKDLSVSGRNELKALLYSGYMIPEQLSQRVSPSDFPDISTLKKSGFLEHFRDQLLTLSLEINLWKKRLWLGGQIFVLLTLVVCFFYSVCCVRGSFPARARVEKCILGGLIVAVFLTVLTTICIFFSMLFQSFSFFQDVSVLDFLFGVVWDPGFSAEGSLRSSGQFGLIPLLAGTLYIAFIALMVAVPIGLMSGVYISEYASSGMRSLLKPLLELLAGIPTLVYGIFALVILGPFLRDLSSFLAAGSPFVQAQSVLTAGVTMGVMLIPVICSLSDDVIMAVPSIMRDGSLALGATHSETIRRVVLPAALPGIGGAVLLAASRALGETMIVVLAAGVSAHLTANPFETMTTITVKIVSQLTGDLEFDSPQTLVAFALGLTLFILTFLMNALALAMVRKHRKRYE